MAVCAIFVAKLSWHSHNKRNTKDMDYKKLLIQQQTVSGSTYTNVGQAVDTQTAFHVVCQEFPFIRLPEAKDVAVYDWPDENGEDMYLPSVIKHKAYDLDATFLYVGTQANMNTELNAFIDFLFGRNTNGSPLLAVYDEYTQTGRRGVYVKSVDNELFVYDTANAEVVGQFKVKFRISDPVHEIVKQNGNIVWVG